MLPWQRHMRQLSYQKTKVCVVFSDNYGSVHKVGNCVLTPVRVAKAFFDNLVFGRLRTSLEVF